MEYSAPPYMHDVLPVPSARDPWLHVARWRAVERVFREACRAYGYREVRTPVMEQTSLFERTVGAGTDIVSKEMFTFTDRGARSMTLRPEGTAPAVRAWLEHGLAGEMAVGKLFYIATIYRYEHGQKGRYREHQQTGVEFIGVADAAADAEVLTLAMEFYRRLGIAQTELRINSVGCPDCRPAYREVLRDFARPRLEQMSRDNQVRFDVNPLRMLDSKHAADRRVLADAPKLIDNLCAPCAEHFAQTRAHLEALAIPYTLDLNLVRGFDYYTRTAFEVVCPALGAQDAIGGGGRYDGLVEQLGGAPTPGIGFGIGTERCLIALESLGVEMPLEDERPTAFVAALGDGARSEGVRLLHALRRADVSAEMDYTGRSLKAQMRLANRLGAAVVVMLGEDELARGVATVREMRVDMPQRDVPLSDVVAALAERGCA